MVRRNAEGQSARGQARTTRLLRWAAVTAFALGSASANAAEVAEVRVGTHEKSTRIVLELNQASGYRLVAPREGNPELLIHLDATSVPRDVPSKSPVVRKVRVEPSDGGSTVRIRLATPNVAVKELLLASPPRLVFDITPQGPIPKATAEEEIAEAPAARASDAEPIVSAPAPIAPAQPAKIEGREQAAEEPKPMVVAAAEPQREPSASAEESPAGSATDQAAPAVPPVPAAEPPADVQPTPPSDPGNDTAPTREAMPTPPPPAETSSATARRKEIAAKAKQETQSDGGGSLASLATSPLGLGGIAAAVLLVGGILVMRRRRTDEDADAFYSPMVTEDAAVAVDAIADEPTRAAPIWEPDAFEASEPALKGAPQQLNLGSRPTPEPLAAEIGEPDLADADSIFAAGASEPEPVKLGSPIAPPPARMVGALSEETERRISELERRIEQLVEARERLERQVAAQTEELRVQRAAIARTQRVVRSIAKTEEIATEPVPRAPAL